MAARSRGQRDVRLSRTENAYLRFIQKRCPRTVRCGRTMPAVMPTVVVFSGRGENQRRIHDGHDHDPEAKRCTADEDAGLGGAQMRRPDQSERCQEREHHIDHSNRVSVMR